MGFGVFLGLGVLKGGDPHRVGNGPKEMRREKNAFFGGVVTEIWGVPSQGGSQGLPEPA